MSGFNIDPSILQRGLQRLQSSRTMQGPSRSLGVTTPTAISIGGPAHEEERQGIRSDLPYEQPPVATPSFSPPSFQMAPAQPPPFQFRPTQPQPQVHPVRTGPSLEQLQQQAFMREQEERRRMDEKRQRQLQQKAQLEREQQMRQQQQLALFQERQRQEMERKRQIEEEKMRKQQEQIEARKKEEERQRRIQAERERMIREGANNPTLLFVTIGRSVLKLEKNPNNPFDYWVNPQTEKKGVARLTNKNPFRIVWLAKDEFDRDMGDMMFSGNIPFDKRPEFEAYSEMPKKTAPTAMKKRVEPQPEFELAFTPEEELQILSKGPVLTQEAYKRDRPFSEVVFEPGAKKMVVSVSPDLQQKEVELKEKLKRMEEIKYKLRNVEAFESEFVSLQTEISLLSNQVENLSQWIDEHRRNVKERKRRELEEELERYRREREKQLEEESSDEELKRAKRLRDETISKIRELKKLTTIQEPQTRVQRYLEELKKLKKDVPRLKEIQTKLEILREIEKRANEKLLKYDKPRAFIEFKAYFPADFQAFMDTWDLPKDKNGQTIDPELTQLTREQQIELLKLYLCGRDAVGVHIQGYVEEILKLKNKYCIISIE